MRRPTRSCFAGLLVAIIYTLSMGSAIACDLVLDHAGLLDIGRVALGADRAQLPKTVVKDANCFEDPVNNYFDCSYTDIDGVSYLAYGHSIERKDIHDLAAYHGPALAAGIRAGDSMATVLLKLRRLGKNVPNLTAAAVPDSNSVFLTTGLCLKASSGGPAYWELSFDHDDRLRGVTVAGESEAN